MKSVDGTLQYVNMVEKNNTDHERRLAEARDSEVLTLPVLITCALF